MIVNENKLKELLRNKGTTKSSLCEKIGGYNFSADRKEVYENMD